MLRFEKLALMMFLLLLSPVLMADDYLVAASDTNSYGAATYATGLGYFSVDTISTWGIGIIDSAYAGHCNSKRDTARWYVEDINEVCDSLFSERWIKAGEFEGQDYFKRGTIIDSVVCRPDTVWLKKETFYFTPNEIERLKTVLQGEAK